MHLENLKYFPGVGTYYFSQHRQTQLKEAGETVLKELRDFQSRNRAHGNVDNEKRVVISKRYKAKEMSQQQAHQAAGIIESMICLNMQPTIKKYPQDCPSIPRC